MDHCPPRDEEWQAAAQGPFQAIPHDRSGIRDYRERQIASNEFTMQTQQFKSARNIMPRPSAFIRLPAAAGMA
jgi:hypothetical protein